MNKKERQAQLVAEMRSMNEKCIAEKRDFTDEESKLYAEKKSELDKLHAEIVAEERQKMIDGFANSLPNPSNEDEGRGKTPDEMKEFRQFLMTGEKRTAMTFADGGGAIAPDAFSKDLIEIVQKEAQFYALVDKIPVSGAGSLGLPYEDTDASDAGWTSEVPENEISADTAWKFGKRELSPIDLTKLILISKKLLKTSALPIEELAKKKLAAKIVAAFENGILNGNGSGQPLGVFTADNDGVPASRDVATTYTSSSSYMVADDLIKLKMSLRPAYRKNAKWCIGTDVLKDIMLFKDQDGQYMWRPGLRDGDPDMLLGLPVYESEFAPVTKTSTSYIAVLGDFSFYKFAYWTGIDIQVLVEKYAGKNQIGYLGHTLADGMPANAQAFARLKVGGSSTASTAS